MRITWLGHASVLLETGAARLLTDPVLRTRVAHLWRHAPLPGHPGDLDAVLVSHVHHDHLDRPTLRALAGPRTEAIVPIGAGRLLAALRFAAVREVTAGDALAIAGVPVRAVPAWHEARRRPYAPPAESVGFTIGRVWFAGDTELHPAMARLRGEVDVALVPVWGWGSTLGPGHMDPVQAARAVALVAPDVAVPIHWGTYLPLGLGRRHVRLLAEPPVRFAEAVASVSPATRVVTLFPGESLEP